VTELIIGRLDQLRKLRSLHGFRAETLVPDLAFIGLVDDVLDASEEALNLIAGPRPYRAYAMVRIAFEAAQRLLVLATADDYVHLGTRAWLYYVGKDESLGVPTDPKSSNDSRDQIIETWASRFKEAQEVVTEEMSALKKIKRPDNFLGRDMAEAGATAYAILAKTNHVDCPDDVAGVTRTAYRSLCRDTHACLRLEPRGIRIDSDGFVDVVKREYNTTLIREGVLTGLSSSIGEAIMAVSFRMTQRRKAILEALRSEVAEHPGPSSKQFRRDFGIFLIEEGLAHATQAFTEVSLYNIGVLPDGTVSSSTTIGVKDEIFMATFDFKGEWADKILDLLRRAFPDISLPDRDAGDPSICRLPVPFTATIMASVGYFRHNSHDDFVPLVVSSVR